MSDAIKKTRFELFGSEGTFEGFTKGDHWNGWECPFFTRAEGLKFERAERRTRRFRQGAGTLRCRKRPIRIHASGRSGRLPG